MWRSAEILALPPKVFNVLHYLVTHPDQLVTKDDFWRPDAEAALAQVEARCTPEGTVAKR